MMDRTDYQILNLLQDDSRCTLRRMGDLVGLTPPAVSERIRRMEESGVIRGYHIDIDRTKLDCNITGFISVALEPDKYDKFCDFCASQSAIISHYHVVGEFNALLRFAVRDTQQLDQLLSLIKKFGDSRTSIELKTLFDSKEIDLTSLPGEALDNASYFGRIFARCGGLSDAVAEGLKEQNIDFDLKPCSCDGIEACKLALLQKSRGRLDANFIEGMACVGGCIGGAGCLTHGEKNKAEVDKYGKEALEKTISDAVAVLKKD